MTLTDDKRVDFKSLRYPFMCYDMIFKSVFIDNENILAKMISDITGLNYGFLENNIMLKTNELSNDRYNEKFKRCDFLVSFNNNPIINLELNPKSYIGLIIKNLSYLFHIYKTNSVSGEEYNDKLEVTQININNYGDSDKALNKYLIKEELDKIYTNSLKILELNIVKCREIYYNNLEREVPNYIKWGTFLSSRDRNEMFDILSELLEEKEVMIIMNKIDNLRLESLFMPEEEMLKWEEWERRSILTEEKNKMIAELRTELSDEIRAEVSDEIRAEGLAEGKKEGQEEKTLEIIKSMLENNASYDFISKVTKKSINDIKEIENSMNK